MSIGGIKSNDDECTHDSWSHNPQPQHSVRNEKQTQQPWRQLLFVYVWYSEQDIVSLDEGY